MNTPLCLNDIKPGEKARVCCLTSCGSIRRRFLDIGLTENTLVECVGVSPLGDPAAYAIRGAVIAIRKTDSNISPYHSISFSFPAIREIQEVPSETV